MSEELKNLKKQLLKDELAKEGYDVGEVEISVGTTYEAVGEDQVICKQLLPAAVDQYIANGDLDAALSDFAASIHDKYSCLNVK